MFERLQKILSGTEADYADIRYEVKRETSIVFNGRELTSVGCSSADGYVLRVLKGGGLATVAFTKESDSPKALKTVQENARIISKHSKRPIQLAPADRVSDTFVPELREDPREIDLDEKLELTRRYNEIPLADEKIVSTHIAYTEVIREKYFMSTEGTRIREDLVTTRLGGGITAREGNTTQDVRVGLGGSTGFAVLRGGEREFEKKTAMAVNLLRAKPVTGGVYNVLLNPKLAGVFTHEAFGHFSEADLIEDSPTMRAKMKIGAKLGAEGLNIRDDPTLPDQLGFYKYDDEGVRARPTQLMKNGLLTGRLHSRRTAAAFGEPLSGHCVAEDYRYAPIVRMGTIYIEPGLESFNELLDRLGTGYYFLDAKGGQTSGENFTFGAQYGYRIRNGKLGELVRDINIAGNLYATLANIVAVGDDLDLSKIGGCGKGQLNARSCYGAPHVLVQDLVVGGV
jgi:TldD protein